jgi:hypothetical protein
MQQTGTAMRKIRIIEHILLDGVIQTPGAPNEDGHPQIKQNQIGGTQQ